MRNCDRAAYRADTVPSLKPHADVPVPRVCRTVPNGAKPHAEDPCRNTYNVAKRSDCIT